MAGITAIISAVAALGSLAASASQVFGNRKPNTPAIASAPLPSGPAPDLSSADLAAKKGAPPTAPNFLQFGTGMTNQQKRAQIATFGTQGSDSRYTDPATRSYYQNLLLSDYDPASGLSGGVLPAERMYAENVLGVKPRGDSAESFLSAILRG